MNFYSLDEAWLCQRASPTPKAQPAYSSQFWHLAPFHSSLRGSSLPMGGRAGRENHLRGIGINLSHTGEGRLCIMLLCKHVALPAAACPATLLQRMSAPRVPYLIDAKSRLAALMQSEYES